MGEKGIGGAAQLGASAPGASSLIEKTTTTVVESVSGIGGDLMTTVQEKAVGVFADEAIAAARERLSAAEPTAPADTVISPEEPPAQQT